MCGITRRACNFTVKLVTRFFSICEFHLLHLCSSLITGIIEDLLHVARILIGLNTKTSESDIRG